MPYDWTICASRKSKENQTYPNLNPQLFFIDWFFNQTRMHSSRMRTVRSSSYLLWGVCLSACWDTHLTDPPARLLNLPPGYKQLLLTTKISNFIAKDL